MQKYLIVFLVIFYSSEVFCQESKISVGVVFSPPLILESGGKVSKSNEIRYNYLTGISGDYKFSSLFSLKSIIYYQRQFIKNEIYGPGERNVPTHLGNINYIYDYLEVPILGSFKTDGKVFLHIDAGPYIAYLLNQETEITSFYILPLPEIKENGERKRYNFGIDITGGLSIPFSKKILFDLGFQANFGLINLRKTETTDNDAIKTNSIGLLFGLNYKL